MTDPTTFAHPIPPPLRQCGRCRLFFPTSGDLHPAELRELWACADCATRIIPSNQPIPADDGDCLPEETP